MLVSLVLGIFHGRDYYIVGQNVRMVVVNRNATEKVVVQKMPFSFRLELHALYLYITVVFMMEAVLCDTVRVQ